MELTSDLQFDVVIAGGGFAGVYCAKALAHALGGHAAQRVALISDQNFMTFQPMLAEVAGSAISPRHVVNPLRLLCRGVSVLRANIAAIDLDARTIRLDAGDFAAAVTARFEHLVLGMGGVVDLSRVPGMPEHAYLMKNVGDALKLRGAVIDRFEEANVETDLEKQKRLLTFVIVGGGYSGVETAGQILDLAKEMLEFYPRIPTDTLRVVLVHSGKHLLPEISESLGKYTEENLSARGMELLLNARVSAMTASRVMLNDGRIIETNLVVSTVGNAPHPLLIDLCRKHQIECEKGRIITDDTMRVRGHERLWSAGDCAAVPMRTNGKKNGEHPPATPAKVGASPYEARPYCPPTAQFAVRQGTLLGKNIARVLEREGHPEPFTFTGLGELAAIGHHAAVAEILGCKFHGFIAWWLWRSVYLMKLPGLERKLRVMIDWTLDLFFPRDIALFQSKPTQLIREMHLEKDDVLFKTGEHAWSLYVVKSGRIELRDGNGAVLRSVPAGHQIGKQTLLTGKKWAFDAVAAEPTELVMVSGKVFETVSKAGATVEEVFSPPALPAAAAPERDGGGAPASRSAASSR